MHLFVHPFISCSTHPFFTISPPTAFSMPTHSSTHQTYEGVLDGRVGDIEKLGELKGNIQLHTTTPSQQREAALKACEEGQKRWVVVVVGVVVVECQLPKFLLELLGASTERNL